MASSGFTFRVNEFLVSVIGCTGPDHNESNVALFLFQSVVDLNLYLILDRYSPPMFHVAGLPPNVCVSYAH